MCKRPTTLIQPIPSSTTDLQDQAIITILCRLLLIVNRFIQAHRAAIQKWKREVTMAVGILKEAWTELSPQQLGSTLQTLQNMRIMVAMASSQLAPQELYFSRLVCVLQRMQRQQDVSETIVKD